MHIYEREHVWGACFIDLTIEFGGSEESSEMGKAIAETVVVRLNQETTFRDRGYRDREDSGAVTPLIERLARVSLNPSKVKARLEDTSEVDDTAAMEDPDDYDFDSTMYLEALDGVDWKRYRSERNYVVNRERERRFQSVDDSKRDSGGPLAGKHEDTSTGASP